MSAHEAPASTAVLSATRYLDEVKRTLLEKNRKYGDSIANPVRIFSKADDAAQLAVRIDDKLSRIRSAAEDEDEDVIRDLIGYLAFEGARRSRRTPAKPADPIVCLAQNGAGFVCYMERQHAGDHCFPIGKWNLTEHIARDSRKPEGIE